MQGKTTGVALGAIGLISAFALVPAANAAEVSYAGKTIQMIVASNAGGGTDRVARLNGLFLEKYLPGNPKIVYRNMGAGGGKIRAANYLALQAKPDGLTVMGTDSSTVQPHSVRRKVAKFDPRQFRPVGGMNAGGSVVFVRKGAISKLNGPASDPMIVGAIAGSRSWQAMTTWGKEFLGWNLKWIPGYKGTGSLLKALRQGEIDMMATASSKRIDGLVKDGVVVLLAQEGLGSRGKEQARKSYPDVPIFPRMLDRKNLPKVAWQGYQSWIGPSQVDKWVTLPPKTPEAHVAAYRAAFEKMVNDARFMTLLKKQFSKDAFILSGATIESLVADLMGVPDEAIAYARGLRKKYGLASR